MGWIQAMLRKQNQQFLEANRQGQERNLKHFQILICVTKWSRYGYVISWDTEWLGWKTSFECWNSTQQEITFSGTSTGPPSIILFLLPLPSPLLIALILLTFSFCLSSKLPYCTTYLLLYLLSTVPVLKHKIQGDRNFCLKNAWHIEEDK